jgi:tetratricopeptide (TPR) repeat protein
VSHLPELLAKLLSETDARDLVDRVGLDATYIEFRGHLVNVWNNVLRAARLKPGKLQAVVDAASARYPDYTDAITKAHAAYLLSRPAPEQEGIQRVFAGVPAQGPPLVGRDKIFAKLRKLAATGDKLVLHGMPGAGKSALALALAYDEVTLTRFGGGVFWAGLGPQANIDNILSLWGTAVGMDASADSGGRPPRTAAERAQRLNAYLQSALGGQPFLVVLDDAWRPEDVLDFEHFATPGSAVLLTTRDEALARRYAYDPSRLVRVRELAKSAALDLLKRAVPEAPAAALAGLRKLARAVGYLPLALVLIGRELAAHAGQERWILQAVERLHSAVERLALAETSRRPGTADVPLSLQAVVELSLDALPDDTTRAAFAELGVFAPKPGDFSRAAALAVWQVSEKVGDAYLRTLYGRGLLESTGQDRFTVHQVPAAVASVRLADTAAVAARHFAYYLAFVDADREAWQAIAAELTQIQQAWDWAARTSGQDRRVLQLVGALHVFMERRGLRAQQRAWLERAVKAARALGDRAEEGRLLGSLGLCWWQLDQHSEAIDCLEHALTLARQTGDRQAEERHLGSLGLVWASAKFHDQAIGYYEKALAIARELGDRQGEGSHLGALGLAWVEGAMAKLDRGEATKDTTAPYFQRAIEYYKQALAVAQAIDDRPAEGSHLGNLGNAWLQLGIVGQAKDLLIKALAILRDIGDRPNEGFHLANLARAHHALGDVHAAQQCGREALAIYDAYRDPRAETLRTWLQNVEKETMDKHRDRRSGEMGEPLDEHATRRLGIDHGFRSAFMHGQPLSRQLYEAYWLHSHGGPAAYFVVPPYEEYLRLYDMYSKACRLRATGLSECEAAEAVRKRSLPDLYPLDEASFEKLGVNHDLRGAFTQGRPLSQDEYETIYYVFEPVLPEGVMPYDDYVGAWYYGELGVGPPSREEYMKQYCSVTPPYEKYLQLYKKYSEESEKRRRKD